MNVVQFDLSAKLPVQADTGSAGFDLFSLEKYTLQPWSRQLIRTGIGLEIPEGFYGRIASRSSMGVKCQDIGAGVIDSSYRGEIKVLLINNSAEKFEVSKNDKIAQIIFEKYFTFQLNVVNELTPTARNDKGFGSSGK